MSNKILIIQVSDTEAEQVQPEVVVKLKESHQQNKIELENGIWLTDNLDGRFYDSEDNLWLDVWEVEADSFDFNNPNDYWDNDNPAIGVGYARA